MLNTTLEAPGDGGVLRRWKLLLALHLSAAFGVATMLSYSLGAVVAPLHLAFGWSRQQIAVSSSILAAGIFPMSFVVGTLADRFGARRILILSQIGLGLCYIALAFTRSLWQFYAIFVAMPLLASGTLVITVTKVVSVEFDRRRGLALGLTLAGTGVCGLIVPLYAAALEAAFGWRGVFAGVGLLPLLLAAPAAYAWVHDPAPSSGRAPAAATNPADRSFGQAVRDYRFWVTAVSFCSGLAALVGVLTSLAPILTEAGFPRFAAAALVSLYGLAVLLGRLFTGLLLDRLWAPLVTLLLCGPAALALLAWPDSPRQLLPLYVLAIGLANGSEYDVSAYVVARYFGLRDYGKIYAGVFAAIACGGIIAPAVYGWCFDTLHSYRLALRLSAAGLAVCAVLPLALGRYPRPRVSPGLVRPSGDRSGVPQRVRRGAKT